MKIKKYYARVNLNNILHHEDPSCYTRDYFRYNFFNDKKIEYCNESGDYHRTDGPAVIFRDESFTCYVNGRICLLEELNT